MARKAPGINTGSSADISFLLLTFFLLTSSINTEQGIPRRLPPPKEKDAKEQKVDINQRNVMTVVVNFQDLVSVNGEQIDISQLKQTAMEFLENANNDPHKPEKKYVEIDNQGTTYNMYVQVQNELQRAVNELRDKVATNYFGKKYDVLDTALQKSIQKAVPMNISEAPPIDYGKTE